MSNVKQADVLKAADGDIIFGNHPMHQHNMNSSMMRANLAEYSTKTLTNSQSDLNTSMSVHHRLPMAKSRSHSTSQHPQQLSNDHSDINSTFIAGSLASAFVSSRKLSLSVDSLANETEMPASHSRRHNGKSVDMSVLFLYEMKL